MERVEAELCELAAHMDAGLCRWLVLLAEYEARGGHETWECRSVAQWASWRCGVARATAWEHMRVARALRELPVMTEAFSTGELSYSKVRALTRIATAESEGELCDLAKAATASQLEVIVRASRRVVKQIDDEQAAKRGEAPEQDVYLRHRWDEDGCLVGEFRMFPEDGALFIAAIEEFQELAWRERQAAKAGAGGDSSAEDSSGSTGSAGDGGSDCSAEDSTGAAGPAADSSAEDSDAPRRAAGEGAADSSAEDSARAAGEGRKSVRVFNADPELWEDWYEDEFAANDEDAEPYASNGGVEVDDVGDGFCSRPFEWPSRI